MTSRERLIATINHRQPDRVCIDLGATQTTCINACALARLREYYKLDSHPIDIFELIQMVGCVEDDLRGLLGVDVVALNAANDSAGLPFREEKQVFTMADGTPTLINRRHQYDVTPEGRTLLYPRGDRSLAPSMVMPKDGYFFDLINRSPGFDRSNLTPEEDFRDSFPLISDADARWYEAESLRLHKDTDYGVVGIFGMGSLGDAAAIPGAAEKHPKGIRCIEDWCMALALYPDYVNTVFEMWTESALKNLEIYRQAVGDRIQVIVISGTDFGTQNAPFMSPKTFRKLYKPYYQRMNDWVHKNTSWKTYYHSCGSVVQLLDDFVEMGVDCLNPVQLSAKGMDPQLLKEKYGGKLVFWGAGVDTQDMLPNGTPEEIRRQVTERLDILAPGGGFVFNTIHNIMGNVKPENIDAVFQTAKNYAYK